jgi:catechol 2,3-dioxygenase-like lactoylglutathione lyase family enzyme
VLGRFLEVSIHCADVLESLRFYERLGFAQAAVGDTWPHAYAVVTDGRLHLGLHGFEFDSPALTFVQPGLRRHVATLEAAGVEFEFLKLGDESFNELGFRSPDGQMITLLEARTFSPLARRPQDASVLDWFEEVQLPAPAIAPSRAFWERCGFVAVEENDTPPRVALTSDSLNVALAGDGAFRHPVLLFKTSDLAARRARIEALGVEPVRPPRGVDATRHLLLRAPEGTELLLTADD